MITRSASTPLARLAGALLHRLDAAALGWPEGSTPLAPWGPEHELLLDARRAEVEEASAAPDGAGAVIVLTRDATRLCRRRHYAADLYALGGVAVARALERLRLDAVAVAALAPSGIAVRSALEVR